MFIGGISLAQIPIPIKAFIYMDRTNKTEHNENINNATDNSERQVDVEQPRQSSWKKPRITKRIRKTLRTRRPPTNIIVNRPHPQNDGLENNSNDGLENINIPRAYSLFDLRTLPVDEGVENIGDEDISTLPPSYSEAAGLDTLPPSYSDTNIARVRLGPYIMLLDNTKIHTFKTENDP